MFSEDTTISRPVGLTAWYRSVTGEVCFFSADPLFQVLPLKPKTPTSDCSLWNPRLWKRGHGARGHGGLTVCSFKGMSTVSLKKCVFFFDTKIYFHVYPSPCNENERIPRHRHRINSASQLSQFTCKKHGYLIKLT